MFTRRLTILGIFCSLGLTTMALANDAAQLRLVPFPKQIELQPDTFSLASKLILEAPAKTAPLLGAKLEAELTRAGLPAVEVHALPTTTHSMRL